MVDSVPRVIAHRGASAEAPENTLPALELALELGVGGVECDVRLTRDEVPVLLHDENVSRTTDGTGKVGNMTLEEIRDLDAGAPRSRRFRGTPVPTLGEALDLLAGRTWVNLELKPPGRDATRLVDAVLDVVDDRGLADGLLLSSFRPDVLEVARRRDPTHPRALILADAPDDGLPKEVVEDLDALAFNRAALSEALVDEVHALGKPIFGWTVNSVPEARRLYEIDVDGLITDDPRRILRVSPP